MRASFNMLSELRPEHVTHDCVLYRTVEHMSDFKSEKLTFYCLSLSSRLMAELWPLWPTRTPHTTYHLLNLLHVSRDRPKSVWTLGNMEPPPSPPPCPTIHNALMSGIWLTNKSWTMHVMNARNVCVCVCVCVEMSCPVTGQRRLSNIATTQAQSGILHSFCECACSHLRLCTFHPPQTQNPYHTQEDIEIYIYIYIY